MDSPSPDSRSQDSPTYGFIGLGNIGGPMARRLTGWPGGLVVRDLDPDRVAPLVAEGAVAADSVTELGERCDAVSVMVLNDAQVRDVVDELLTTMRTDGVIAVHSTIEAPTAVELAERAAAAGVRLLDAPVSGGFIGAAEGRLAVLVGGDEAAIDLVRGPWACFADLVIRFGPVGAGTQAKLARNLLHFTAFTAAAEAQQLAAAAGIDLASLSRVVRHSDAVTGGPGSIMLRTSTEPLRPGDDWYDTMCHVRSLGEKDLDLALGLARELGVDLPLASLARTHLAAGLGVPED
ncbi:MAG: NAD(P)-dependent oxidoreductase [Acidobacteria bacterium]|nr:NAD(P)-dependent oxidoreductase [Acidobacteriota bacterium]